MRTTTSDLRGCYRFSGLPERFIRDEYPLAPEVGTGLYLVSETAGAGKTLAAVGIAKRLIDSTYGLDERTGYHRVASVRFVTHPDLMGAYRATYSDGERLTEEDVTRRFACCDLLVIDDLGKAKPTDWAVEKTFQIVNGRYERCLPTVVTTQYLKSQLVARLAESGAAETAEAIVSRLTETCRTVTLQPVDRRIEIARMRK